MPDDTPKLQPPSGLTTALEIGLAIYRLAAPQVAGLKFTDLRTELELYPGAGKGTWRIRLWVYPAGGNHYLQRTEYLPINAASLEGVVVGLAAAVVRKARLEAARSDCL